MVVRPKTRPIMSLTPPKKDYGILGGLKKAVKDIGSFPVTFGRMVPTLVGKAGQSVYGLGETLFDIGADVVAPGAYTSRSEVDLAKGRELGLTGPALLAYSMQRTVPLIAPIVESVPKTAARLAETGTLGLLDTGEEGFDYYQALRSGELGNMLLEDVGNVMLAGRTAGLGSVAGRAGARLTNAGRPGLGTAIRRAGYFSEQPIAATTRGLARLGGRAAGAAAPRATGRAGRLLSDLSTAGQRISVSEKPIRTAFQASDKGVSNYARGRAGRYLVERNALEDQIRRSKESGVEPSQDLVDAFNQADKDFAKWNKLTNEQRNLIRSTKTVQRKVEDLSRVMTQNFARFSDDGAIPEKSSSLLKRAQRLRDAAEQSDSPGEMIAEAEYLEYKARVKDSPEGESLTDKQQINDSFGAAMLVGSRVIEAIKQMVDSNISIDQAIKIVLPRELPEYVRSQGYDITPSAVQKALDYIEGRANDVDNISIQEALMYAKTFSDFMTIQRQTGRGMVRGAASPLETGVMPMPEYVLSESARFSTIQTRLLGTLDEFVANIINRDIPELAETLELDLTKPDGLFERFAKARPDSPEYLVAARAVAEAIDFIRSDAELSRILEDPMIYPAPVRPFMSARGSGVEYARGEDLVALADELDQFAKDNPDLLPESVLKNIKKAVENSEDPQKRYDLKSYQQVERALNGVVRAIDKAREKIVEKKGQLASRSDKNWQRLEDLSAATQLAMGMIQEIIDNPSAFADQKQLAEVARLRGVSEGARAGLEEMGDVSPAPAVDTTEARQPLSQENLRLVDERRQIADELIQKQAKAARFRARQQRAAEVADDDLASLQTELDEARLVREEFGGTTEATVQEARAARAEEVGRLQEQVDLFEYNTRGLSFARDIVGKKRYGGEDARGALERGLPQANQREVFNAFMRRFAKTRTPKGFNPATLVDVVDGKVVGRRESPYSNGDLSEMATEFIENFVEPGRPARYALPEDAITDMMAEFAVYYEAKKRLEAIKPLKNKKLDNAKLEEYRTQLSEDQDAQAAQYMDRAYADAGVRSPEELIELIGDKTQPEGLNSALGETLSEIDALNRRAQEIDQRIESNKARIEQLWQQQEASIPVERIAEQGRLRAIGREATEQASELESATLKKQQQTVRARLKGVGRVTPDGPELQKQFGGRIDAEQARILAKEQANWVKMQQYRATLEAQDAALAAARQIPEAGGRMEAQLAQPILDQIGGNAPLYIPTGASRGTSPRSIVETVQRAQGIAPESVASVEKMRTGSILPMTPGQMAARVREIMQSWGRNVVIQSIINNREYVSTLADVIPEEVRATFRKNAEQKVRDTGRPTNSKDFQNLVDAEYNKMLMDELRTRGLDPISPVEMPDPTDPYAERQALQDLQKIVNASDLTDNTLVMSANMRAGLASQFEPKEIARGYSKLNDVFNFVRTKTADWKSVTLPFSVRWQMGDHISTVLNAWLRGDIPPRELYEYMGKAMERFKEQPGSTRRNIMFGEGLEGLMADPVSQALEAMGLQQSGLKTAEIKATRRGTLVPGPESIGGRRMFPRFRKASFAFNEFQNRLGRHAVAMKKLTDILEAQGRSIDEVSPVSIFEDPVLYKAVEDSVNSANEVLGNFSQLDPYERQVVRTLFPFWAWIKFINKAAADLLVDQPDRVLFMAHLGGMTMEEDAQGLWDFLKGDTDVPGFGFTDLSFIQPYSDAFLFSGNPMASFLETGTSFSPVVGLLATVPGEVYYGAKGRRLPFAKTLSRPGYLEGRPGETTRTWGDVAGGLGYRALRDFGGPFRNILDILPEGEVPGITGPLYRALVTPQGTIRGTDIAVGPVERFGQGSRRTEGQFGVRRLSPTRGRLAAVARTFGLPAPKIESDVAARIARQNVQSAMRARLRRQRERRLSRP